MELKEKFHELAFINDVTIDGHGIININGGYKISKTDEQDTLNYLVDIFDQVIKKSKLNNKETIIINVFLDNYSIKNIRQEFIINSSKVLMTLYPDNLEQCNIINSSYIFQNILTLIKAFMDPVTKKKIIIKNI